MYEIDAVRGYVLGYYNQGEADRRYRILTRDFGVIFAHATSVRKEQSKLKHALQKLNLVEIEIIQSRRGYQITGGRLISDISRQISRQGLLKFEALGVLDRIGLLIGRLSQNPDSESNLFDIFEQIIDQLSNQVTKLEVVELWGTARVLIEFGYFDSAFSKDIDPGIFQKTQLNGIEAKPLQEREKELERYINQCLDQTML